MAVYGGLGPMTNAVLWVEVFVSAVFVTLRVYTRQAILRSVGWDDYLIIVTLLLQLVYTIFVTIATQYGLGMLFADVGNPTVYFTATMWEVFSQVAGISMIGVGKCSVGFFLLRIVQKRYQIALVWLLIIATTLITIFASTVVVVQCIPVEKTWNPTSDGQCWINFSYVGFTIGSWFVAMDFAFAILPCFVIWGLNMKRKEKITVACGLSLGVFAGTCGIVRTVALDGLDASEYIYATVPMLIWSGTECVVTIMCSSIPVLRPLYVRYKYGSRGDSSDHSGSYSVSMPKYNTGKRYALGPNHGMEPGRGQHRAAAAYVPKTSDETVLRDSKAPIDGTSSVKITEEFSIRYENNGPTEV